MHHTVTCPVHIHQHTQLDKHTQQVHMLTQPYFTLSASVKNTHAIISVAIVNVKACCISNILPRKHGWSIHEVGLYDEKVSQQSFCLSSSFTYPTYVVLHEAFYVCLITLSTQHENMHAYMYMYMVPFDFGQVQSPHCHEWTSNAPSHQLSLGLFQNNLYVNVQSSCFDKHLTQKVWLYM